MVIVFIKMAQLGWGAWVLLAAGGRALVDLNPPVTRVACATGMKICPNAL
jgi:hypothetical protein